MPAGHITFAEFSSAETLLLLDERLPTTAESYIHISFPNKLKSRRPLPHEGQGKNRADGSWNVGSSAVAARERSNCSIRAEPSDCSAAFDDCEAGKSLNFEIEVGGS